MPTSEPDGGEIVETVAGKRISKMISNNAVIKFFSGAKQSIERMTFKISTWFCLYASTCSASNSMWQPYDNLIGLACLDIFIVQVCKILCYKKSTITSTVKLLVNS